MKSATVVDYEDDDYAKLLGDATPPRSPAELVADLKGQLKQRATELRAIDSAIRGLIDRVKVEGVIRGQIRQLLDQGGRPLKDTKIQLLSGVDIVDRILKQLAAGNVIGGDKRDDKSIPPATCSQLADHHEAILELFEKALAGEAPREPFASVAQVVNY